MVVQHGDSIDNNVHPYGWTGYCWWNYQRTAASRVTWQMNCKFPSFSNNVIHINLSRTNAGKYFRTSFEKNKNKEGRDCFVRALQSFHVRSIKIPSVAVGGNTKFIIYSTLCTMGKFKICKRIRIINTLSINCVYFTYSMVPFMQIKITYIICMPIMMHKIYVSTEIILSIHNETTRHEMSCNVM